MANLLHNKNRRSFYEGKTKIRGTTVLANHVERVQNSSKSQITCKYVTLVNKSLTGSTTIDGVSPTSSDRILVANQTDKKQNGVYTYNDSGDWVLEKIIEPGVLITITGGTKQGTVWVVETPSFKIGTDNISIVEHSLNRKGSDFDSFSSLTAADEDLLLAEDYSDSYNKKSITFSALKTFLNFLSKAANQFTNFGNVTPEVTDVLLIEDADDSFSKKNITLADLLDLVPAGLLVAEKTLYVSPTFPNSNQMYSTLTAAIAYANANSAFIWTIIVYPGTYTGNYDLNKNIVYSVGDVTFIPSNANAATFTIEDGMILGYPVIDDAGANGTSYMLEIKKYAKLELKSCLGGYGAIKVLVGSGSTGCDIQIDADTLGRIYDTSAAAGKIEANIKNSYGFLLDGHIDTKYEVRCQLMNSSTEISKGTMHLDVQKFAQTSANMLKVDGADATLIASGRLEDYSNGTDAPIVQTAGKLVLNNLFAKNAAGSVVDGTAGELFTANTVLEAGALGGGYHPTINGTPSYKVRYSNATSLNSQPVPIPGITQRVTGNKTVEPDVKI